MATQSDIPSLVQVLARDPDLSRVNDAAVALSTPGATSKASASPEYGVALERLLALARNAPNGEGRLRALVILARLRKQQNKPFGRSFEQSLAVPMGSLTAGPWELTEPKDRNYLAQALRFVRFSGQFDYLATFVASEAQPKSDARDTAAIALVELSDDLGSVFQALGRALIQLSHDTKDPGTTRAHRLMRALDALRAALREFDPAVGPETGTQFATFLRQALGSIPAERSTRIDVANAGLGVLESWVRPNFSLARRSATFEAITVLRRLFLPARWPDETEERRVALGRVVREAIQMLAEGGVTDDGLRGALVTLLDRPGAQAVLGRIARNAAGLEHNVRHWLDTGRSLRQLENAEVIGETVLNTIDRDLAEAFRDAELTLSSLRLSGDDLRDALAASSPGFDSVFAELVGRADRLGRRVESLAAQRGFELEGEVGAAVEYAPADHLSDESIAGLRVVRVVLPRVVRRHTGSIEQTVLKAKVEPI
jgi:hypothetical protein